MQDRLDDKIDKLTAMMTKVIAQGSDQNKQFKPKSIKAKGGNKQEIIMIRVATRIDIDQIVEIECHLELEVSMEIIIEKGHNMIKIIEVIFKEVLDECKVIEVKILEGI